MLLNAQAEKLPFSDDDAPGETGVGDAEVQSAFQQLLEGLAFAHLPFKKSVTSTGRAEALGPRGGRVLTAISNGFVYPSQISDVLGVRRNMISMDLDRLEKAELVRMKRSANDRRRCEIVLTAMGKQVAKRQSRQALHFVMRRLADHSAKEIAALAKMLHRLGLDS